MHTLHADIKSSESKSFKLFPCLHIYESLFFVHMLEILVKLSKNKEKNKIINKLVIIKLAPKNDAELNKVDDAEQNKVLGLHLMMD